MSVYADSSFFVSRYVADAHSAKVDQALVSKPSVWFTPFNRSELAGAIYRQTFLKRLTLAEAHMAWSDVEQDCAAGIWVPVGFPSRAWETCVDLAKQYVPTLGVRTLDSLHVACALELRAEKFWTFDERQARLAEAVGLDTTP